MRPTLKVLSDELIDRIIDQAMEIMATVGMEIRGPAMRQRLIDAGLPIDPAGRIRFPRDVVEQALATAPSSFVLHDRDGTPHADLGGDRVHFVPGSSGLRVLDHRTGEARLANSTDFVEYVRLADGLKHIAYLATAFSTNKDIEIIAPIYRNAGPVNRAAFGAWWPEAYGSSGKTVSVTSTTVSP